MSSCDMMDGGLHLLLNPVFMVAAAGYTAWIAISHACKKVAEAGHHISNNASNLVKNSLFKKRDSDVKNIYEITTELENSTTVLKRN